MIFLRAVLLHFFRLHIAEALTVLSIAHYGNDNIL